MRTRAVPATEITTRTLRASDYVFSPTRETNKLIDSWLRDNPGFMHRSTPAMKDLRLKIHDVLRRAMEAGRG